MNVLIVCDRRYNGLQLWTALRIIDARGHTFEVVSTSTVIQDEESLEAHRIRRTVDMLSASEADNEFQALMFISGYPPDTRAYWHNRTVELYVEAFNRGNKPIAAICASVPSIRGACRGKKVSFYPLVASKQLLRDSGAILQFVTLTRDQNIVTAEHEMAADVWAEEFCNLLEGKPQQYFFEPSGFTPQGRKRRPDPDIERLKSGPGVQYES